MNNIDPVVPGSHLWKLYVDMSISHILSMWPDFSSQDYESLLKKRYVPNRRLYAFFRSSEEIVGLVNAYLETKEGLLTLFIAEFMIVESYRRQGLGSCFFEQLKNFGKNNHAQRIELEVDKRLSISNAFWQKQDLILDSLQARNRYFNFL